MRGRNRIFTEANNGAVWLLIKAYSYITYREDVEGSFLANWQNRMYSTPPLPQTPNTRPSNRRKEYKSAAPRAPRTKLPTIHSTLNPESVPYQFQTPLLSITKPHPQPTNPTISPYPSTSASCALHKDFSSSSHLRHILHFSCTPSNLCP